MFYIRIHNAGIPDGPDDHDETDNINYYDGIYKLVATILSEDVSLKALKIDTSQSGIDYMADHTKFKDGSITSIKNAIQIGNTNQYFAVVNDATQNLKIYVYGEGEFASTISVNNKKVNADSHPCSVGRQRPFS